MSSGFKGLLIVFVAISWSEKAELLYKEQSSLRDGLPHCIQLILALYSNG